MPTISFAFRDDFGNPLPDALELHGPSLQVEVGFDADFLPGAGVRPNSMRQVSALLDTGAEANYIDATLAHELGLPVLEDRQQISGALGSEEVNVYIAQIYIPSLEHTIVGRFAEVRLADSGLRHRVLIGRGFLRRFRMLYDGRTGVVILSDE